MIPSQTAIPTPAFLNSTKEGLTGTGKPATVTPQSQISITLTERGTRYGKFSGHAEITQRLKDDMRNHDNWYKLNASQKEALEMIAHKIGRIINGDPNYADSWHDISGYSTLIEKQINGDDI